MKKVQVVLSSEAEEVYTYLVQEAEHSKTERTILDAFNKKKELIKLNPHFGDPVAKKLIPSEYKTKYEITNLFRFELPNFWRCLYTLVEGENTLEIIAFVLDISDHKKYDKKFGYRKK